jgi:hypothetical protein
MRERTPLRRPLFEPGDPRRFDAINTGGPLNDHYFRQLKPAEESTIINGVTHKEISGTEPSPPLQSEEPLEIVLVEMPRIGELNHTTHVLNSHKES